MSEIRGRLATWDAAVIGLTVLVLVSASLAVENFGTSRNFTFLVLDLLPIALVALPMTFIIVTGEIDLSVASVVGLSTVLVGVLHEAGLGIPTAALLAIAAGALCGALNGFLVAYVGLPSLAVTIGTLALFRGLAVGLLGTKAITEFDDTWTDRATAKIGDTPVPQVVILFVVLAVVFALLLHFSPFGRGVYDVGLNAEAARFTGVDVARTKLVLFVLSGAVSALAGVYYVLRFGSARGDNATGLELQVIAAVLLGGVSIFGGRGRLHGVIAGVLLIGVVSSAMRLEGITVNVINIIIGLLLVASVMSPSVLGAVRSATTRRSPRGDNPTNAPLGVGTQEGKNP